MDLISGTSRLDSRLHTGLKRHGRHTAVSPGANKLEFNNVVVGYVVYFHIATVGFRYGADRV